MTEKELYAAFAATTGDTEKQGKEAIETLIDIILTNAEKDGKCVFGKLGQFEVKTVAARAGRHVTAEKSMTGKAYDIAPTEASTKIGFKLSKAGKKIGK